MTDTSTAAWSADELTRLGGAAEIDVSTRRRGLLPPASRRCDPLNEAAGSTVERRADPLLLAPIASANCGPPGAESGALRAPVDTIEQRPVHLCLSR